MSVLMQLLALAIRNNLGEKGSTSQGDDGNDTAVVSTFGENMLIIKSNLACVYSGTFSANDNCQEVMIYCTF